VCVCVCVDSLCINRYTPYTHTHTHTHIQVQQRVLFQIKRGDEEHMKTVVCGTDFFSEDESAVMSRIAAHEVCVCVCVCVSVCVCM
jgi:hypothetical protein